MKAYEYIKNSPQQIGNYKKQEYDDLEMNFPFELGSADEICFYEMLDPEDDNIREVLWYESDKKFYQLYIYCNWETEEIDYTFKAGDILGVMSDGTTNYDAIDDYALNGIGCLEEAIDEFLGILKRM